MTKKDFIAMAKIIRALPDKESRECAAINAADYFITVNRNFDRERFYAACGRFEEKGIGVWKS